ncbi:hypothetical protein ACFFX1_17975 [Dactylosporangium sucinum]|uniref:Lipoprotein n=1 Tax=Dactylosporangium sucinum TaxID=1424081 RepID=A0A917TVQ4_9ACTN|nr:hypothetical protein [Dactylosporangium sucinum]GGM40652.1 hypothetical protein GCM10007977_047570 [Dactylosporangium sucinum]
MRAGRLLLALLVALGAAGCAREPELRAGCTPPAGEEQLLDAYADEPVFDVEPPGAKRVGKPRAEHGCRVLNFEDTSSANVMQLFELSRGYSRADLAAVYDEDLRGRGWVPAEETAPPGAFLVYCKLVRDVPAVLSISSPGSQLQVAIRAEPQRPCP